jgi:hypothetical protein
VVVLINAKNYGLEYIEDAKIDKTDQHQRKVCAWYFGDWPGLLLKAVRICIMISFTAIS